MCECFAAAAVFGWNRYAQQPDFSGWVPVRTVDLVLLGELLTGGANSVAKNFEASWRGSSSSGLSQRRRV